MSFTIIAGPSSGGSEGGSGVSSLSELTDVDISTTPPEEVEMLIRNSASSDWTATTAVPTHNTDAGTITAGTIAVARMGSGATGDGSRSLRDNNTWAVVAAGVENSADLDDFTENTPVARHVYIRNSGNTAYETRALEMADIGDAAEVTLNDNQILVGVTGATPVATDIATAISQVEPKVWSGEILAAGETLSAVTGLNSFPIVPTMSGMNVAHVQIDLADASTPGAGGVTTFQLVRERSGGTANVCSTAITIDASEESSADAATPYVINTSNDDALTKDRFRFDCTGIPGTPPVGPIYGTVTFQRP